jgi:hypothetical protein
VHERPPVPTGDGCNLASARIVDRGIVR